MPKQFISAVTFTVLLVAIAFAANRAEEETSETGRRGRGLASVGDGADFGRSAKLHGPVEVRITADTTDPIAAGVVFTLSGELRSAEALDHVAYRWSLPPGVELINGELAGELPHLDANQAANVTLTLKAHANANAQIHLLAHAKARGARFAESAQFNTTAQAAFARSRRRLGEATAAPKVMH